MTEQQFHGIDLANGPANLGKSWATDDGKTLKFTHSERRDVPVVRTAIDSPFGTSHGFWALLSNKLPDHQSEDGFKSRQTEIRLRETVNQYECVQRWRNRSTQERKLHPREPFFNGGGHVQSTLAMRIVPECLKFIIEQFQTRDSEASKAAMLKARMGEGKIVEAHPRMFLYSILERLFRNKKIGLEELNFAAKYKSGIGPEARETLLDLICENTDWFSSHRTLDLSEIRQELIESDHQFDSALCVLTGWAHYNNECVTWESAQIDKSFVETEGHILVLDCACDDDQKKVENTL